MAFVVPDNIKMEVVKDKSGHSKDLVLTDVVEQPVQQEVALEPMVAADAELPVEEATVDTMSTVEEEPPQETKPKSSFAANNFSSLKKEATRLARERDEAKALIAQYEAEKRARQTVAPVYESPSEEMNIDDDSYAEGKQVKQLAKQMKMMQQKLEASERESRALATRAALISEHPDYERVMSPENLKALELTKPHFAKALNMADPYSAGKACYEMIKVLGIDAEELEKTEVVKGLIQENRAKPKVGVQALGTKTPSQTPMGRMSEFYEGPLTDEMKKIFYKEMQDAMGKLH